MADDKQADERRGSDRRRLKDPQYKGEDRRKGERRTARSPAGLSILNL